MLHKKVTNLDFNNFRNEYYLIGYFNICSLTVGSVESNDWHFENEHLDLTRDVCYEGNDTYYPCFCPQGEFCCEHRFTLCDDMKCCPYNTICGNDGDSEHPNICIDGKNFYLLSIL